MMRTISKLFLAGVLTAGGCGPSGFLPKAHKGAGKGDQIGPNDNPANLIPNADTLLADMIGPSDVGQDFGVDDAHIPYPDTYWPFTSEGVDNNWSEGSGSPLEKFMAIAAPDQVASAKQWEHANHGNGLPGVQDWFGHCPGWTGAAMVNAPIQHAVDAKSDGNGGFAACAAGDSGCTHFEIGDINALMAEVYVDGNSSFIGARCDTKPSAIKRDGSGRIVRNGSGCQGLNAGALLIVAGNLMKQQKLPFAIDAQDDFNTDQIWNQPAYRYHVYRYQPLNEAQAANLVAHGTMEGREKHYQWDDNAVGWAMVDLGIKWVSENGPNTRVVSGADSTREMRVVAVIELDSDASDPNANIIGGEYLNDRSARADRLTVPPFVWTISDAGPDGQDPSSTSGHNPYVQSSLVKQLIALGQQ